LTLKIGRLMAIPRRSRVWEHAVTDPEGTAQDASVASAPAAFQTPVTARDLVSEHDPAIGQAPATGAPRRRWRWAVFLLAAVVVLGLAGGLVAWAPWTPPPVLRPTGLVADPSTANSIAFHWSRPPTGPLPDKYLILGSGTVFSSVAGTVTSYRQASLTPGTTYQYRVVAVRGGKQSPRSALLTVHTLTPPISQARLQGSWQVYAKNIGPAPGSANGYMTWQLSPVCAVGACDVMLDVMDSNFSLKMRLTRAGSVYKGQTVAGLGQCGSGASSIPDPTTVKIKIRVTLAVGEIQEWAATSLTGTMVGTSQYVSSASFYCPASTFKASLAGTQS
jgi:hypothetical protein